MELKIKNFKELSGTEVYEILRARAEIFVLQQGIKCCDPDGLDYECTHCMLYDGDTLLAYLRAHPTEGGAVKIGRVLTLTHGLGHGLKLMRESMPTLAELYGTRKICVNAQRQAEGFYKKLGFVTVSDEFLEEGVAHVAMEILL